jgi:hypothetical protein
MKKYLVLYLAPASVIDDWKKTEPGKRKEAEQKMQGEWKKWMSDGGIANKEVRRRLPERIPPFLLQE